MQSFLQNLKHSLSGNNKQVEEFTDSYDTHNMVGTSMTPSQISQHVLHSSHLGGDEGEHMRHISPASGNKPQKEQGDEWLQQEDPGGELAVDVYHTDTHIIIKSLIAGVTPGNIDIAVTREMIVIKGSREDDAEAEDDQFFQRELYWGPFSRSILLPEEVDIDLVEAQEKHGVLTIRLPKINKARQAKVKIKRI